MHERELRRAIQEKKMNFLSERDATASYRHERYLLELLARGELLDVPNIDFPFGRETMYDDAVMTYKGDLKQTEYYLVAAITLGCRAIIMNGADPFEAYRISDIYLQQLSECTDERDMIWVGKQAMVEYNDLAKASLISKKEKLQDLENAKTYICRHLRENITMREVCHAVGVSERNLSNKFRETGTTFRKYVMEERLKMAANLLAQTQEPINVISDYLCFSSPSYFGSCFLKKYGRTPQEYHRRHVFSYN